MNTAADGEDPRCSPLRAKDVSGLPPELAGMPDVVDGFRDMRDGAWDAAEVRFEGAPCT